MDIVSIITYTTLGVLVLSKLIAIFCWKDYYFIYNHRLLFVLGKFSSIFKQYWYNSLSFQRLPKFKCFTYMQVWCLVAPQHTMQLSTILCGTLITDNDGGFVRSAVLSNIQESLSSLSVIVMAHSADSFVGRFRTLLLSTTAYIGVSATNSIHLDNQKSCIIIYS